MAISFKEAIAWAKARGVELAETYYKILPASLRQKVFTIAGIAARDQLQMVLDSLAATLENGKTFDQWRDEVTAGSIGLGLPTHRLDNIFRTNLQIHYNRGHWEQQLDHKKQRPFLMYDAVNDRRTRLTHKALDGVIKRVDDPFWHTYYPPNGFRCRCSAVALSEKQAESRGGATDTPADGWPAVDKGWDFNPGVDPDQGLRDASQQQPGGSALLQKALMLKLGKEH